MIEDKKIKLLHSSLHCAIDLKLSCAYCSIDDVLYSKCIVSPPSSRGVRIRVITWNFEFEKRFYHGAPIAANHSFQCLTWCETFI